MYIMPYKCILLCDCLPTSISVVQNMIGNFPGLVFTEVWTLTELSMFGLRNFKHKSYDDTYATEISKLP